jgi:hypothetical protein
MLVASRASADEDLELLAAQQELKLARRHLQQAPHAYEGRRRTALDHVNRAIQDIRVALREAREARGEVPRNRKEK